MILKPACRQISNTKGHIMQDGKLNIVTDGQHGSTGKGLITTYLAWKHKPGMLSTTNMANAGHTAVNIDGQAFVAKALPSASILTKWLGDTYKPLIFVGASAAFDLERLLEEAKECMLEDRLVIHPRAGVITREHKERESSDSGDSTKHLASTMQGCGTFLADKVLRKKDLKLARDYEELAPYVLDKRDPNICGYLDTETMKYVPFNGHGFLDALLVSRTILHEGSQGFSLDINHGSHYPQCTSRGTTAMQNLADLGLNHKHVGDIYLVFRPYPIRVGNVIEDGILKGESGGCYPDNQETTWEAVAEAAGAPAEIKAKELTTVTKRLRRVFTFSMQQLKEAIIANGATKLVLNFANYIDWKCYQANDYDELTPKVYDFIHKIEHETGIKVALVGTGPQIDHVVDLR